jgi:hypothetical protein
MQDRSASFPRASVAGSLAELPTLSLEDFLYLVQNLHFLR